MELIILIIAFFLLLYALFFMIVSFGWLLYVGKNNSIQDKQIKLSVIVPFRNELENLPDLINSLDVLEYPEDHCEFIFVDDHSEDGSFDYLSERLEQFSFSYKLFQLDLSDSGKKMALIKGVDQSQFEHIVTTDADCIFKSKWLYHISKSFVNGKELLIGQVINKPSTRFIGNLQSIEAVILNGISLGMVELKLPLLCSGAHLAFRKSLFEELKPFEKNMRTPSGDDMFFLNSVQSKNKSLIGAIYGVESQVSTNGSSSFLTWIGRSTRWASKTTQLGNVLTSIIGLIVLISNYSFLFLLMMCFFYAERMDIFIKLCTLKIVADILILFVQELYHRQWKMLIFVPFMVVLYPLYLLILPFFIILGTRNWKNRDF